MALSAPGVLFTYLVVSSTRPRGASAVRDASDVLDDISFEFEQDHAHAVRSGGSLQSEAKRTRCGEMMKSHTCGEHDYEDSQTFVFDTMDYEVMEDKERLSLTECVTRCQEEGAKCCNYMSGLEWCVGLPTAEGFLQDDEEGDFAFAAVCVADEWKKGVVWERVASMSPQDSPSRMKSVRQDSKVAMARQLSRKKSVMPKVKKGSGNVFNRVHTIEEGILKENTVRVTVIMLRAPHLPDLKMEVQKTDLIGIIKERASEKFGADGQDEYPAVNLEFQIGSGDKQKVLQDDQTVGHYNIQNGTTIWCWYDSSKMKVAIELRTTKDLQLPPRTMNVVVLKNDRVSQLKEKVVAQAKALPGEEAKRLTPVTLELSIGSGVKQRVLQDYQEVGSCNIQPGTPILVTYDGSRMQVAVELFMTSAQDEKPRTMNIVVSKNDPVSQLKEKISAQAKDLLGRQDVPAKRLLLTKAGPMLHDQDTLTDSGIQAGDTIQATLGKEPVTVPNQNIVKVPIQPAKLTSVAKSPSKSPDNHFSGGERIVVFANGMWHRGEVRRTSTVDPDELVTKLCFRTRLTTPRTNMDTHRDWRFSFNWVEKRIRFDSEDLKNLDAETRTAKDMVAGGYVIGDEVEFSSGGGKVAYTVDKVDNCGEINGPDGLMLTVYHQEKHVKGKRAKQERPKSEVAARKTLLPQHPPQQPRNSFARMYSTMPDQSDQ
jgi:hypothetical protein